MHLFFIIIETLILFQNLFVVFTETKELAVVVLCHHFLLFEVEVPESDLVSVLATDSPQKSMIFSGKTEISIGPRISTASLSK